MFDLLIATRSAGKTREIREMLEGSRFAPLFPDDVGLALSPDEADLERGERYVDHAVAKARYFARRGDRPTAADDSGLEVDALGGAPGVHSARWAGGRTAGDPEAEVEITNNAELLARLREVPTDRRTARYRCVAAFVAHAEATALVVEATCEGRILPAARGKSGFGYDPLFWSPELGMTFGEAPPAAKHRVSHRGRAFRALIEALERQLER
jgi:XTP/dITP diphosphohydrolase